MPHEFDSTTFNSTAQPAPPPMTGDTPRMTEDEARAVIALWQSEQMDSPQSARPTPADVAEGLGIETADAARLLSQVRQQRQAAQDAARAAAQEELARAERAARLAELRARQAEAEAREARARTTHHVQTRTELPPSYSQRPRISPPTADDWREVTQREAQIRAQENHTARTGWIITAIAAVIGFAVACGLAGHVFSSLPP